MGPQTKLYCNPPSHTGILPKAIIHDPFPSFGPPSYPSTHPPSLHPSLNSRILRWLVKPASTAFCTGASRSMILRMALKTTVRCQPFCQFSGQSLCVCVTVWDPVVNPVRHPADCRCPCIPFQLFDRLKDVSGCPAASEELSCLCSCALVAPVVRRGFVQGPVNEAGCHS